MAGSQDTLQITLAPDGFFPQTFRWQGRIYRVLAVHSVRTGRSERFYRVITSGGYFELVLHLLQGTWRMRRRPTWLSRAWYHWLNGARYPLPIWRRRSALVAVRSR
ncbi:MAG TPA: hypothetical protein VGA61_00945 [Anaerolineae bacterium]